MGGDLLAFLAMVITQFGFAGMNIISKLAMDSGLNPFVLVAYRQIFATIAIAPFAYLLERKTRPKITLPILFQIFISSIIGVTLNQVTYFIGLKNSTPTIACALSNLLPAITFLLAILFGLENVGIKSKAGKAKVLGTVLCVGGAMVLSFYHGHTIDVGNSSIHWKYAQKNGGNENSDTNSSNFILGPFMLIASSVSWAAWFVMQAKMSESFAAPYTSSALLCLMASVQCVIIGLCVEHNVSAWSLSSGIRAISCVYAGIVCSALAICLMSWCIQRKGPLYVSVFSPLLLIIVAILSWALLQEKLYLGTLEGSVLIVMGLYGVLWGKNKEVKPTSKIVGMGVEEEKEGSKIDLELQLPTHYGNCNDVNATSPTS